MSLRIEEGMGKEQQGIGSIIGLSSGVEKQRNERTESLRRTFSADMSSKKWLAQNLPLSLRKIASTEQIPIMYVPDSSSASSSSSASEDEEQRERKGEAERSGEFNIWSSILSQKKTNSNSLTDVPYVHPLVKRSKNSLSGKSLQICTESLGSETGSDGFSSSDDRDYFSSDGSDDDEEEHEQAEEAEMHGRKEELVAVNYNWAISRKSPPRSFPPPLTSISHHDRPCLRMIPGRKDGRLVVEAVPAPSLHYLHAQRQGGRLYLSFINSASVNETHIKSNLESEDDKEVEVEEKEEEDDEMEIAEEEEMEVVTEEEDEEEKAEEEQNIEVVVDKGIVMEVKIKQGEVMRMDQPQLVMNKIIGGLHAMHLNNPNPWVDKKKFDDGGDEPRRVPQILTATAFNGYDRCWKSGSNNVGHKEMQSLPKMMMLPKKPMVIQAKDFLPLMRCKEHGRPVLVWDWQRFCIPTS